MPLARQARGLQVQREPTRGLEGVHRTGGGSIEEAAEHFCSMSRTLLSSDPDCRQHKPPIVGLEAFDRLLTSDAEIRDKRLSDAEATQVLGLSLRATMVEGLIAAAKDAGLTTGPRLDSDWWLHDNPASSDPRAQWRRDRSAECRRWVLIASVWFVLAWVLGALFDPLALYEQGTQRITNWGGVDCLLWLAVSLVPVADWRLKVYCDRYVR